MTTSQAVAAIVAAVLLFWGVGAYNRLMSLRNAMRTAFGQLDAQVRRRHDLIPHLAEAARAAPGTDTEVLDAAVAARHQAHAALDLARAHPGAPGPMVSLAMAEQVLEDACRRLQQAIDRQPALRGEPAVQAVRDDLLGAEGRLGFARQMFNDTVTAYNTAAQEFPTRVLSSLFGFREAALLPAPVDSGPRTV
jgi:LemA protein